MTEAIQDGPVSTHEPILPRAAWQRVVGSDSEEHGSVAQAVSGGKG